MSTNTIFEITDDEHRSGALSDDKLAAIRQRFESDGFAVVAGIIPLEVATVLHDSMLEDVAQVRSRPGLTAHERATGAGHLQLGPRRAAPYVHAEVLANPLIEHVVATMLGPGAWLGFVSGNVNCPGSAHQPLHFDRPFSWKTEADASAAGQPWPPPSTTVSCSVALSDITEATGATEIYPGSQRETAVIDFEQGDRLSNHPELLEKWGPPSRMTIPAGGVCFHDPRMWHRGVPNPSDEPRPMPALTYHSRLADHFRGGLIRKLSVDDRRQLDGDRTLRVLDDRSIGDGRIVFDASAREAFDAPSLHDVQRYVRFVEPPQTVNHFLDNHTLGGARVADGAPITPYPDDDAAE